MKRQRPRNPQKSGMAKTRPEKPRFPRENGPSAGSVSDKTAKDPRKPPMCPLEKVADFRKTPGNRAFSSPAIDRKTNEIGKWREAFDARMATN
jgi:hypothetical protein